MSVDIYKDYIDSFNDVTSTVATEPEFWNTLLSKMDEIVIVLLVIANLICVILIYIVIHNMIRGRKR